MQRNSALVQLARLGWPLIAGGSGEDHLPPGSEPPPDLASLPDPNPMLATQLTEYQRLAEERAAALTQRDAELEVLRQTAAAHEATAQQAQAALLEAHRARLLAEHAGQIVPELVQGGTVEELSASVEAAKAAHARIAESIRQQAAAAVSPGNAARTGPDPSQMSSQEKIVYALRRNGTSG
jgi:multidrug efflux pump subunit AcrA (membrane-fusion protein)